MFARDSHGSTDAIYRYSAQTCVCSNVRRAHANLSARIVVKSLDISEIGVSFAWPKRRRQAHTFCAAMHGNGGLCVDRVKTPRTSGCVCARTSDERIKVTLTQHRQLVGRRNVYAIVMCVCVRFFLIGSDGAADDVAASESSTWRAQLRIISDVQLGSMSVVDPCTSTCRCADTRMNRILTEFCVAHKYCIVYT